MEELGEELQEARDKAPPPLSGAAAERVQIILEAAERSAAELESRARESAERATREADDLAREVGTRAEAEIDSRANRVEQATDQMLRRTEELESELSAMRENLQAVDSMVEGLGAQTGPLRAEVDSLRGGLVELRERVRSRGGDTAEMAAATGPGVDSGVDEPGPADRRALDEMDEERASRERSPLRQPPEPRGAEEEIAPQATDGEDPTLEEEELLEEDDEAVAIEEEDAFLVEEEEEEEAFAVEEEEDRSFDEGDRAREEDDGRALDEDDSPRPRSRRSRGRQRTAAPSPSSSEESDEGARLVALNMALNGTPRDETDRYLAENFELRDRDSLLDEVYARVSGT